MGNYENDFYGWTKEQASLLRAGKLDAIDISHLIEEIESMGNCERRELENCLEILFMNLLKWQHQPTHQGRNWKLTITEQRRKIERRLKKNPSLRSELAEIIIDSYGDATYPAARETNLDISIFPATCPWTFEQAMESDYFPD